MHIIAQQHQCNVAIFCFDCVQTLPVNIREFLFKIPPLPRFNLMPATSLFIIRRAHNPAKSFSLLCQNKVFLTLQACRTNFLDPTDAEVLFNSRNVPESDLSYKTVRWNFLFTGSLPCSPASLAWEPRRFLGYWCFRGFTSFQSMHPMPNNRCKSALKWFRKQKHNKQAYWNLILAARDEVSRGKENRSADREWLKKVVVVSCAYLTLPLYFVGLSVV